MRKAFHEAAEAYGDRDNPQRPQQFADAMKSLAGALGELGRAVEPLRRELPIRDKDEDLLAATAYPPPGSTAVEVLYNRLDPFYWAWAACLLAVLWLAASLAVFRKAAFWLGAAALAGGMAMIVVGFSLRADYPLGPGHEHVRDDRLRRPLRRAAGDVVHMAAAPGRRHGDRRRRPRSAAPAYAMGPPQHVRGDCHYPAHASDCWRYGFQSGHSEGKRYPM